MTPEQQHLLQTTRRHFFGQCGVGLGSIALASLLGEQLQAATAGAVADGPMSPRPPHFAAKAKNVIFLFMAGGPSQLELFDYKPKLQELSGQQVPESYTKNGSLSSKAPPSCWARAASSRSTASRALS
jgi:hypothetical protein